MKHTFASGFLSEKRLIIVLREPVAREFSFYEHLLRGCVDGMRKHVATLNYTMPPAGWDVSKLCANSHLCPHMRCHSRAGFVDPSNLPSGLYKFEDYYNTSTYTNSTLMGWNISSHRGAEGFLVSSENYNGVHAGRSFYAEYIRNYLTVFNRSQIFICNFERLIKETSSMMNRLKKFLSLSKGWGNKVVLPHDNKATVKPRFDCRTRDALAAIYEPHNEDLYRLLREPGAPPEEPPFLPFADPRDYPCSSD